MAAVGLLGAAAGVGVAVATDDDPRPPPPVPRAEIAVPVVSYSRCPGGEPVGTFQQLDRVLATGRTDDTAWIEVRDPVDLTARVWIPARAVDTDDDADDLRVTSCPTRVEPHPTTTTTTATTTTTSTTTTTVPGAPSTTGPGTPPPPNGPAPPTNAPPPPPATSPPDTTPPTIGPLTASETEINENFGFLCSEPFTFVVSATVTDPSGVASVIARWSVGSESGTVAAARQGNQWRATIGPFGGDTVQFPFESSLPVSVRMRATDFPGNQSGFSPAVTVTLNDCPF